MAPCTSIVHPPSNSYGGAALACKIRKGEVGCVAYRLQPMDEVQPIRLKSFGSYRLDRRKDGISTRVVPLHAMEKIEPITNSCINCYYSYRMTIYVVYKQFFCL